MWLLKTEPDEYSWHDLVAEKEGIWNGVRAPAALKNLKQFRPGDRVFIYHTGREKAVVGIARALTEAYPDPSQNDDRLLVVRIAPVKPLSSPVSLRQIKESGLFPDWDLLRLPRLSVVPVSNEQWNYVIQQSEK